MKKAGLICSLLIGSLILNSSAAVMAADADENGSIAFETQPDADENGSIAYETPSVGVTDGSLADEEPEDEPDGYNYILDGLGPDYDVNNMPESPAAGPEAQQPSGSGDVVPVEDKVYYYGVSDNNLNTNFTISGIGAEDIYSVACAQLNELQGKFTNIHYGLWCADFVSACAAAAGQAASVPGHCAVSDLRVNIKNAGGVEHLKSEIVSGLYVPVRGDIIIFKSNGASHVGIVDKTVGTTIYYIDGNCTLYGEGPLSRVHYSNRPFSYSGFTSVIKPKYRNTAAYVTLNHTAVSLVTNETLQLTASVRPSDITAPLVWSSDDPDIASVSSSGKVTAKAPGTAVITVSVGTVSASCTITVNSAAGINLGSEAVIPDGVYYIKKAGTDFAVSIKDQSAADCGNVVIWAFDPEDLFEQFEFTYQGEGYYSVINKGSGKALDVDGAGTVNLTNVHQYTPNGSNAQLWQPAPTDDGFYNIVPKCAPALVLDVSGNQNVNGTNIALYASNGSMAQKFELYPAEPQAPVILEQPQSVSGKIGETVSYHVTAENVAEGGWQWYYSRDGGEKWYKSKGTGAGTDTVSVTLNNSNFTNIYRCMLTGTNGEVIYSEPAGNIPALVILSQPVSVKAAVGDTVTFTVDARNVADGGYQWYYSKDGGASWYMSSAAGSDSADVSFVFKKSNANNIYMCRLIGTDGCIMYSNTAGFITDPVIIVQPSDCLSPVCSEALFTVTADNVESWQWYYSKDGGVTWFKSTAKGFDTDTIVITVKETNKTNLYRCKLTSPAGVSLYTDAVGFDAALRIKLQPENVKANIGDKIVYTLEAVNVAAGGYQWYYSTDGGVKWYKSSAEGANTATLSLKVTSTNRMNLYRCKLTGVDGTVMFTDLVGII